jgi:hypothetical protein
MTPTRFLTAMIAAAAMALTMSLSAPIAYAQSTNVQPQPAPAAAPAPVASAAPARTSGNYGLRNPLGATSVPVIIGRVVSWLGGFAGSLFFLYLLWGGFEWMTAGGEEKRVKNAQNKIVAAASGIAVILISYMAVAAIIGIVPG